MPLSDEGTTYIELRAKLDQLKRDLNAAEALAVKAGDSAAKKTETRWSKIGSSLKKALPAVAKSAGLAVAAGLGYAAKAASDLNETIAFTEVTFKDAAGTMEAWGDSTLESMGLAKESALDAANGFGGLFQTTGATAEEAANLSQSMVQLAVDMSSAKNVGLDETMLALKSGLIGEAEPMRKFNVLLSEAAVNEEAYASGIAKRGAELTEGQKVQARMNIIMEQTTDIQGDYSRTSGSAANQGRKMQESMKQLAGELGQGLLPVLVSVLEKLNEFVSLTSDAFKAAASEADNLESSKVLMTAWAMKVQDGSMSLEQFKEQVHGLSEEHASLADKMMAGLVPFVDTGDVANGLDQTFGDLIAKIESGEDIMPRFAEGASSGFAKVAQTAEEVDVAVEETRRVVHRFAGLSGKELKTWTADTVGNFNLVEGALGRLVQKHKVSAEKIKAVLQKALEAQLEFGQNWATVVDKAGPKAEEFLKYVQENFGAEAAQVVAVLADQNKAYLNDIVSTWARGEASAERLAGVVGREFGQIRGQVRSTAATVGGLGAVIDRITAKFSGMAAAAQIKIATEPAFPRAEGGPVSPAHTYLVGERGPELFVPRTSGTIVPDVKVGGGNVFHINIRSSDPRGVVRELRRELDRLGA